MRPTIGIICGIITSSIESAYEWGVYYDADAKCDGIGYDNEYYIKRMLIQ